MTNVSTNTNRFKHARTFRLIGALEVDELETEEEFSEGVTIICEYRNAVLKVNDIPIVMFFISRRICEQRPEWGYPWTIMAHTSIHTVEHVVSLVTDIFRFVMGDITQDAPVIQIYGRDFT